MQPTFIDIQTAALGLPEADRLVLAQTLWDSLSQANEPPLPVDRELLAELRRRSEEMASGKVRGIPHEEVMASLRAAIPCK